MAYMSQENKKSKEPKIKAILKKFGIKGSVSVDNHSGLTLTIKSGAIDFFAERELSQFSRFVAESQEKATYMQVNPYHFKNHFKQGSKALKFLTEVHAIMNKGNHDKSDPMSDYFDVGWYVYINIGKWNKPYILTKE